ncbi:cytochrome b561 domain-containing protein [Aspergillus tanneri]|uniref:Cytochrome b561 domain-containing protein n=1 Tax=Aspergillus tanneri TaxID=1220188 RepID=A0A5M9MX28_9EURO|nr:uncharacterized protein ATNIH1004_000568 [Aspergillus tanneri]KAA8651672.1 hypothetical protein ATNIH1004_000568 [Aspergillus tanneri]
MEPSPGISPFCGTCGRQLAEKQGPSMALAAHGVILSIAFVALFPCFAISIHISYAKTVPRIHSPLQLVSVAFANTGVGLGIYFGVTANKIGSCHSIIGLLVMGFLTLFQLLMGLVQHIHFQRTGGKSLFTYMHRWLGRLIIVLGIVNGGIGFLATKDQGDAAPAGAIVVYSVVAGVVGVAYTLVEVILPVRSKAHDAQKGFSPTVT